MGRVILLCMGLVAATCGTLRAEEHDGPPRELPHILERASRGEPLDQHALRLIDRFAKDYLFRVECNVLEDSRFSLAQLEVKTGKGEQAIETLQKLAAATKDEDVRSAAMYDIGKVYQVALRDVKSAAGVYAKVTGRFRAMAQRSLIVMYEQAGRTGEAVKFLKDAAAKAKDKGEKLALLRRLGEVAQRAGKNEEALAAYRKISDEFTEKDIREIRAAAARHVRDAFAKAMALRRAGRGREAEQVIRRLRGWASQLVVAGRMDEFRAVREEHERNEQRMHQRERKMREEKREHDERRMHQMQRRMQEEQRERKMREEQREDGGEGGGEHGDGKHGDGERADGEHGDGEHGDGEHGDGERGDGEDDVEEF